MMEQDEIESLVVFVRNPLSFSSDDAVRYYLQHLTRPRTPLEDVNFTGVYARSTRGSIYYTGSSPSTPSWPLTRRSHAFASHVAHKIVVTLDVGPSAHAVDCMNSSVIWERMYPALEKFLLTLVSPLFLPGCTSEVSPRVVLSVLAQGAWLQELRVVVHALTITPVTLRVVLDYLKTSLSQLEEQMRESSERTFGKPIPTFSFTTALRNSVYALKQMPEDACSSIVIMSDGASAFLPLSEVSQYDNLLMMLNRDCISCHALMYSHQTSTPTAARGYLPSEEFLSFVAVATNGYVTTDAAQLAHSVLFKRFSLHEWEARDTPPAPPAIPCLPPHLSAQKVTCFLPIHIIHDAKQQQQALAIDYPWPWVQQDEPPLPLMRWTNKRYTIRAQLQQLIDLRLREGFTLQEVYFDTDPVTEEGKLVETQPEGEEEEGEEREEGEEKTLQAATLLLAWKPHVFLQYRVALAWTEQPEEGNESSADESPEEEKLQPSQPLKSSLTDPSEGEEEEEEEDEDGPSLPLLLVQITVISHLDFLQNLAAIQKPSPSHALSTSARQLVTMISWIMDTDRNLSLLVSLPSYISDAVPVTLSSLLSNTNEGEEDPLLRERARQERIRHRIYTILHKLEPFKHRWMLTSELEWVPDAHSFFEHLSVCARPGTEPQRHKRRVPTRFALHTSDLVALLITQLQSWATLSYPEKHCFVKCLPHTHTEIEGEEESSLPVVCMVQLRFDTDAVISVHVSVFGATRSQHMSLLQEIKDKIQDMNRRHTSGPSVPLQRQLGTFTQKPWLPFLVRYPIPSMSAQAHEQPQELLPVTTQLTSTQDIDNSDVLDVEAGPSQPMSTVDKWTGERPIFSVSTPEALKSAHKSRLSVAERVQRAELSRQMSSHIVTRKLPFHPSQATLESLAREMKYTSDIITSSSKPTKLKGSEKTEASIPPPAPPPPVDGLHVQLRSVPLLPRLPLHRYFLLHQRWVWEVGSTSRELLMRLLARARHEGGYKVSSTITSLNFVKELFLACPELGGLDLGATNPSPFVGQYVLYQAQPCLLVCEYWMEPQFNVYEGESVTPFILQPRLPFQRLVESVFSMDSLLLQAVNTFDLVLSITATAHRTQHQTEVTHVRRRATPLLYEDTEAEELQESEDSEDTLLSLPRKPGVSLGSVLRCLHEESQHWHVFLYDSLHTSEDVTTSDQLLIACNILLTRMLEEALVTVSECDLREPMLQEKTIEELSLESNMKCFGKAVGPEAFALAFLHAHGTMSNERFAVTFVECHRSSLGLPLPPDTIRQRVQAALLNARDDITYTPSLPKRSIEEVDSSNQGWVDTETTEVTPVPVTGASLLDYQVTLSSLHAHNYVLAAYTYLRDFFDPFQVMSSSVSHAPLRDTDLSRVLHTCQEFYLDMDITEILNLQRILTSETFTPPTPTTTPTEPRNVTEGTTTLLPSRQFDPSSLFMMSQLQSSAMEQVGYVGTRLQQRFREKIDAWFQSIPGTGIFFYRAIPTTPPTHSHMRESSAEVLQQNEIWSEDSTAEDVEEEEESTQRLLEETRPGTPKTVPTPLFLALDEKVPPGVYPHPVFMRLEVSLMDAQQDTLPEHETTLRGCNEESNTRPLTHSPTSHTITHSSTSHTVTELPSACAHAVPGHNIESLFAPTTISFPLRSATLRLVCLTLPETHNTRKHTVLQPIERIQVKPVSVLVESVRRMVKTLVSEAVLASLLSARPLSNPLLKFVKHHLRILERARAPSLASFTLPLTFLDRARAHKIFVRELERAKGLLLQRVGDVYVAVLQPTSPSSSVSSDLPSPLPYWLLMSYETTGGGGSIRDRLRIWFQNDVLHKTERGQLFNTLRTLTELVCKRVNQLCLLNLLHEVRTWDTRLEPYPATLASDLSDGTVGFFSCPRVHVITLPLHHRVPATKAIGALVGRALQPFALLDHPMYFVYPQKDGAVFYLRISQTQQQQPQQQQQQSASASVSSLPSSGSIVLEVFGVDVPTTEITEQLYAVLDRQLSLFSLSMLSALLERNPLLKLTADDIAFVRGSDTAPSTIALLALPSAVHAWMYFHFLRDNTLQYLTPMHTSTTEEMEALSREAPIAERYDLETTLLYNYIPTPGKAATNPVCAAVGQGLAIIRLGILSASMDMREEQEGSEASRMSMEDWLSLAMGSYPAHALPGGTQSIPSPLPEWTSVPVRRSTLHHVLVMQVWGRQTVLDVSTLLQQLSLSVQQSLSDYVLDMHMLPQQSIPLSGLHSFMEPLRILLAHAATLGSPTVKQNTISVSLPTWAISPFFTEAKEMLSEQNSQLLAHVLVMQMYPHPQTRAANVLPPFSADMSGPPVYMLFPPPTHRTSSRGVLPPSPNWPRDLTLASKHQYHFCLLAGKFSVHEDTTATATVVRPSTPPISPRPVSSSPSLPVNGGVSVSQESGGSSSSMSSRPSALTESLLFPSLRDAATGTVVFLRQCLLLLVLKEDSLSLVTYNWSVARSEQLDASLGKLRAWVSMRNHLLSSLVHQKLRLFFCLPPLSLPTSAAPQAFVSGGLRSATSAVAEQVRFSLDNMDVLLNNTVPPRTNTSTLGLASPTSTSGPPMPTGPMAMMAARQAMQQQQQLQVQQQKRTRAAQGAFDTLLHPIEAWAWLCMNVPSESYHQTPDPVLRHGTHLRALIARVHTLRHHRETFALLQSVWDTPLTTQSAPSSPVPSMKAVTTPSLTPTPAHTPVLSKLGRVVSNYHCNYLYSPSHTVGNQLPPSVLSPVTATKAFSAQRGPTAETGWHTRALSPSLLGFVRRHLEALQFRSVTMASTARPGVSSALSLSVQLHSSLGLFLLEVSLSESILAAELICWQAQPLVTPTSPSMRPLPYADTHTPSSLAPTHSWQTQKAWAREITRVQATLQFTAVLYDFHVLCFHQYLSALAQSHTPLSSSSSPTSATSTPMSSPVHTPSVTPLNSPLHTPGQTPVTSPQPSRAMASPARDSPTLSTPTVTPPSSTGITPESYPAAAFVHMLQTVVTQYTSPPPGAKSGLRCELLRIPIVKEVATAMELFRYVCHHARKYSLCSFDVSGLTPALLTSTLSLDGNNLGEEQEEFAAIAFFLPESSTQLQRLSSERGSAPMDPSIFSPSSLLTSLAAYISRSRTLQPTADAAQPDPLSGVAPSQCFYIDLLQFVTTAHTDRTLPATSSTRLAEASSVFAARLQATLEQAVHHYHRDLLWKTLVNCTPDESNPTFHLNPSFQTLLALTHPVTVQSLDPTLSSHFTAQVAWSSVLTHLISVYGRHIRTLVGVQDPHLIVFHPGNTDVFLYMCVKESSGTHSLVSPVSSPVSSPSRPSSSQSFSYLGSTGQTPTRHRLEVVLVMRELSDAQRVNMQKATREHLTNLVNHILFLMWRQLK